MGTLPEDFSFIEVSHSNISLEALKKAEDEDALILRVVERCGMTTNAQLFFYKELEYANECNLMEEKTGLADYHGKVIKFRMKPYEIKTFLVKHIRA